MGRCRLVYIAALVCTICFYAFYPLWFSWYLLVVTLLLVPLDLILSLPVMWRLKLLIEMPKVFEVDSNEVMVIRTYGSKPYPVRCVKIKLKTIKNDSGSVSTNSRKHTFKAHSDNKYEIEIDTSQSGVTTYEVKHMWVVSLLGLFALPGPVRFSRSILVLPKPLKPPLTIALPRGMIFQAKPGGGFAEDHDLRVYRQGDPVRSIHWKVSAKFDSLIIREPLVPPANSRLILVTEWTSPEQRDIILGRLRWVSDFLLKWEIPYFVKFGDAGAVEEIAKNEELNDYLYRELCQGDKNLSIKARARAHDISRFTWSFKIDASDGVHKAAGGGNA